MPRKKKTKKGTLIKKNMKKIFLFMFMGAMFASCASKKTLNQTLNDLTASQKSNKEYAEKLDLANKHLASLLRDSTASHKKINQMAEDSVARSKALHQMNLENKDLKALNNQLSDRLTKNSASSDKEIKSLLADLQKSQEKLQAREDALTKSEKVLKEKEKNLAELQSLVDKQDSMMKGLKNRVSAALKGYEGNGIEVVNKNGKVYVSLDEKLLFKSGKWDVDAKGANALNKLSNFIAENKDINIVIEGHTDDVPLKPNASVEDNWDLSAKRATAIVRILIANKNVNPSQISASGRAEFVPVDPAKTPEARAKNRRTEIILSPNMDELLKAMSGE